MADMAVDDNEATAPVSTARAPASGSAPTGGADASAPAVWERIRVRLDRHLHIVELHAHHLLDRALEPAEVRAVVVAAEGLAAAFAALTLPDLAGLARRIPAELHRPSVAVDSGDPVGVRIASIVDDIRVLFASAVAEQSYTTHVGGTIVVVGPAAARLDALMWVVARRGSEIRHSSGALPALDPATPPAAVVIGAGAAPDDEIRAVCRAAREQVDAPIVILLDPSACGGAWARTLAAEATTIVPADIDPDALVVELARLRAQRATVVRAQVCGTVAVERLVRHGVEVTVVPRPDDLVRAARSGGAIVFGADVPTGLVLAATRLIRSTPATRNLPVWAVMAAPDDVVDLQAAGLGLRLCPELDDVVVVSMVQQLRAGEREVDLGSLESGTRLSWAATRVLVDRSLIAAHRSRSPVSIIAIDTDADPGSPVHQRLAELLAREFRRGDVTGTREPGRFVVALNGMPRASAATRMEDLVERFHLDDGTVRIGVAQFPGDGRSAAGLVAAADAAVERSRAVDGPIVTTTTWRPDGGAAADVMVVDADPVVARMIVAALTQVGITTDALDDGRLAFDHLRTVTAPPRVLVLDLDAPRMDGLAVLRDLRPTGALGRTAVVVTSARSSEADTRLAFELGAVDVIRKPLTVTVLTNRIRRLLEGGT